MSMFELWAVVAAKRDVTGQIQPPHETQRVKNHLQAETHDDLKFLGRTYRQTDTQTDIHLQIRRAAMAQLKQKKNRKNHKKFE